MKKALCLLMVVAMLLPFALTSCDPTEREGDPTVYEEYPEESWVELDFFHFAATDDVVDSSLPIFRQIAKRTGVIIDWDIVTSRDDLNTRIPSMQASDTLPDIFNVQNIPLANEIGAAGQALELSDMWEDPLIKKWTAQGDLPPLSDENGNIYVLSQYRYNGDWITSTMFYRKDLLNEMGLDMPFTTDEWYQTYRAVKTAYPNVAPLANSSVGSFHTTTYEWGFNLFLTSGWFGTSVNCGKTLKFMAIEPEFYDMVTYFNKLYNEDLLKADYADSAAFLADVTSGNVFAGGSTTMVSIQQYNNDALNKGVNIALAMAMAPGNDAMGKCYTYTGGRIIWDTADRLICINPKSPYVEEAKRFLLYLYTDEFFDLYHFGFEGQDYTINADGTYSWVVEDSFMASSARNRNNGYPTNLVRVNIRHYQYPKVGLSMGYEVGDEYDANIRGVWTDMGKVAEQLIRPKYYQTAENAPQELKQEYETLVSVLNGTGNTAFAEFITNARPLSEFDMYVEEMKQLGCERAVEIAKPWHDDYFTAWGYETNPD